MIINLFSIENIMLETPTLCIF